MEEPSASVAPATAEEAANEQNTEVIIDVDAPGDITQPFSFNNNDYCSSLVELPMRVVDLVKQYETATQRIGTLTKCLEESKSVPAVSSALVTAAPAPVITASGKVNAKPSPASGVISGKVITGKIVGKESNEAPIQATTVPDANSKAVQKLREEYNDLHRELQRNLVDAALLADCRAQLHEKEEEIQRLNATRRDNAIPLDEAILYAERLFYENVREAEAKRKLEKENSFLNEKNTQLEGQLQRLLTSSFDHFPSAHAEAPPAASKPAPAGPSAAEVTLAAEKEQLEKQITELNGTLERYRTRFKKEAEKRNQLEEEIRKAQEQNAEMQASILVFRRQMNEKELDLVRQDVVAADEQRLRDMEKECARLRNTMRERLHACDHDYAVLQEELKGEHTKNKVYAKAVEHLQRELVRLQIEAAAVQSVPAPPSSPHVEAEEEQPPAPRKTHKMLKEEPVPVVETVKTVTVAAAAAAVTPPPVSLSPVVVGGPAINREKQLEELRLTYDRRVEAAEALKRAEIKQVQALNKELRQALATSQAELVRKARVIEQLKDTGRPGFLDAVQSPDVPSLPLGSPENSITPSQGRGRDQRGMSVALSELEMRYDPENMSEWEAVHLENEVLLQRLTIMQEEKWSMSGHIEDLQLRCSSQQMELRRNAEFMQRMIHVKSASGGEEDANIRFLQSLLEETLAKNIKLEEEVHDLNLKLGR